MSSFRYWFDVLESGDGLFNLVMVGGVMLVTTITIALVWSTSIGMILLGLEACNSTFIWASGIGPQWAYKLMGIVGFVFWTFFFSYGQGHRND